MRYRDIPDYYGDPPACEEAENSARAYDTLRAINREDGYALGSRVFEYAENRAAYAADAATRAQLAAYVEHCGARRFAEFVRNHFECVLDGLKSGEAAAWLEGLARGMAAQDDWFFDWLECSAEETGGAWPETADGVLGRRGKV